MIVAEVESPWNWILLGVVAFIFVGSIALGRYFRHRDAKLDAERSKTITVTPVRPPEGDKGRRVVYSCEDTQTLLEFLHEYHEEVDRLARGYHGLAIVEGEESAKRWLEEQTGRKST